MIVPKGFLPSEDQDRFNISVEGIQGIGFDEMLRHQMEVADDRREGSGHHRLQQQRRRRRWRWRRRSAEHRAHGHRPEAQVASAPDRSIRSSRTFVRRSRRSRACACSWSTSRRSTSAASRARAASTSSRCRTPTRRCSIESAPLLEARIKEIPGVEDVNSDLRLNNPQIQVDIDRDRVSSLGLTVNQVETALYNSYGTRQISQIYAANNQYAVIMGVAPEFQQRSGRAVDALRALVERQADSAQHRGAA